MDFKNFEDFHNWWRTEPFGFDNPDTYNAIKKLLTKRQKEIDRLKKQIEKVEKTLRFYADKDNWDFGNEVDMNVIDDDDLEKDKCEVKNTVGGKLAREYFNNKESK